MCYISIIVPVYNAESTLNNCVDSILEQEFHDFELLLVDDGSKDNSPAICDEYAEKDFRVRVFHKVNGGVSSARNIGLDEAKGEWISFVDSDDFISDGFLNGIVHSSEDIIFKGYCMEKDGLLRECLLYKDLCGYTSLSLLLNHYITNTLIRGPVFKFYKKELIGNLRFLTDMRIGEDAWFMFHYLSICKSFCISDQGNYIVNVDDRPDEVKYAISVDYAVQSLTYLKDAFDILSVAHHVDRGLFFHYIGYFKRISKSDWMTDKRKWYSNQQVNSLYNYVWSYLSAKQKLRLTIARLLKW